MSPRPPTGLTWKVLGCRVSPRPACAPVPHGAPRSRLLGWEAGRGLAPAGLVPRPPGKPSAVPASLTGRGPWSPHGRPSAAPACVSPESPLGAGLHLQEPSEASRLLTCAPCVLHWRQSLRCGVCGIYQACDTCAWLRRTSQAFKECTREAAQPDGAGGGRAGPPLPLTAPCGRAGSFLQSRCPEWSQTAPSQRPDQELGTVRALAPCRGSVQWV